MYISKKHPIIQAVRNHDCATGYETKIEDVNKWFKIFNREIFKGELEPFHVIEIRQLRGSWAECEHSSEDQIDEEYYYCNLVMSPRYKSFPHFLMVLAHECVHNWQWNNKFQCDHGKTFFKWKARLKQFEIPLMVSL